MIQHLNMKLVEFYFNELKGLQVRSTEQKKSNAKIKSFYFNSYTNSCYRKDNRYVLKFYADKGSLLKKIIHYFKFKIETKYILTQKVFDLVDHNDISSAVLILPRRDDIMVFIDLKCNEVYKLFLDKKMCQEMLNKDLFVSGILGDKVPKIISSNTDLKSCGIGGYIQYEMILNDSPVYSKDMDKVMKVLTPWLLKLYKEAGVKTYKLSEYIDLLNKRFFLINPINQTEEYKQRIEKFRTSLSNYLESFILKFGDIDIYSVYAHADLAPANIHRSDNRLYLIDWGSSGWYNVFFDIFMLEYQDPNSKLFDECCSIRFYKKSVYGEGVHFINFFQKLSKENFSTEHFKIYSLISALEILLRMRSYQNTSASMKRIVKFEKLHNKLIADGKE